MIMRPLFTLLAFILLTISVQSLHAATALTKVLLTTGSVSEREAAVYVAQEQGYFRKYGVDVQFIQARNGPVGMAALSSGESQFHWGSVSGANLGAIAEGADIVFVAGFINRLTGMFMANSKIKSPAELRGKSVGVNSLSGGGWIFSMLTLDHWGLSPERDKIQFRSLGDQTVMVQGLMAGIVDAALVGYAHGKNLQNKGYTVLADVEKLPIPYQGSGLMSRRNFMRTQPAVAESVFRGLLDAVNVIRNPANKAEVLRAVAKGMRLAKVEDAEEGYKSLPTLYDQKIYPSVDGIRNVIRLLGSTNEKIRKLKAEDLVEDAVLKKLEKEGRF
ncbi:MAG TPA: ABC transporter substrate-binding protein [Candidatus Limnocylindrales bacterium]|nr:ABC transporter substrate-binding protein [Candidatus Limnocylindrales bacterium]